MTNEYKDKAFSAAIEALCICHPDVRELIEDSGNMLIAKYFFASGYEAAEAKEED